MTGTQLLFYQRDLFVDEAIQIQFQRMYGYKLEVPKTQDEYLNVARFLPENSILSHLFSMDLR